MFLFVTSGSIDLSDFRRWIQAVFRFSDFSNSCLSKKAAIKENLTGQENAEPKVKASTSNSIEVDISDGLAAEMFGILPSLDSEVNVSCCLLSFLILSILLVNCFENVWPLSKMLFSSVS